jgi:hypothetical protein
MATLRLHKEEVSGIQRKVGFNVWMWSGVRERAEQGYRGEEQ